MRGLVRSLANKDKIDPLVKVYGDLFGQLELVEGDLDRPESIEKAFEGCTYAIHLAVPPPPAKPRSDDEVIKPQVEAAMVGIRAAHKMKVKRLVFTSSVAAKFISKDQNKAHFTDEDWSDLEACSPFFKSKVLAEKAVWDYNASLPE